MAGTRRQVGNKRISRQESKARSGEVRSALQAVRAAAGYGSEGRKAACAAAPRALRNGALLASWR